MEPAETAGTHTEPDIETLIERRWKWLVAAGVLALCLGAVSIVLPVVASVAAATLVGWLLILGSGLLIADASRQRRFWSIAGRVVLALLWVVAGLWLLLAPLTGAITLTVVLIAWFWANGAVRLVEAIADSERPDRVWAAIGGVLSLLLGLLIWLDFPSSGTWAIGLLVGISLLFYGTDLLLLGLAGRRLGHRGSVRPRSRPA
jgi:uncharacterized membrane protein HdeD (DUF308 family)